MNPESLARIGSAFVDAAVNPTQWNGTMDLVAEHCGAIGAVMLPVRNRSLHFPMSRAMAEPTEIYIRDGWDTRDERDKLLFTINRKGVGVDLDFTTPDEMRRSPYYREFLEPHGLRWFAGLSVKAGDYEWILSIQRSIRQGPFLADEVVHLTRLSQGLSGTIALAQALGDARAEAALAAFEASGRAVLLVGRSGDIIRVNPAAEKVFDYTFQLVGGRVVSIDREATAQLERELRWLLRVGSTAATAPHVVFRRPGRNPLIAYPMKLSAISGDALASCRAVVVLRDAELAQRADEMLFSQAFGLTAAEARLAARLLSGRTLREAAVEFGSSYETVRSQLRSIFEKTATSGQTHLFAVLMRLSP